MADESSTSPVRIFADKSTNSRATPSAGAPKAAAQGRHVPPDSSRTRGLCEGLVRLIEAAAVAATAGLTVRLFYQPLDTAVAVDFALTTIYAAGCPRQADGYAAPETQDNARAAVSLIPVSRATATALTLARCPCADTGLHTSGQYGPSHPTALRAHVSPLAARPAPSGQDESSSNLPTTRSEMSASTRNSAGVT